MRWIETTLQKIKQQDYAGVDWENLVEEIEAMGRSEKHSLESNLIVIVLHLLKWQYQPERRSGSWAGSIVEHRRRVSKSLKESPSLKPYLEQVFDGEYRYALRQAVAETQLSVDTFPSECPYTIDQVLDQDFMPR